MRTLFEIARLILTPLSPVLNGVSLAVGFDCIVTVLMSLHGSYGRVSTVTFLYYSRGRF